MVDGGAVLLSSSRCVLLCGVCLVVQVDRESLTRLFTEDQIVT